MGPNMVSVGDPAEIPNIYSTTSKFTKVSRRLYTHSLLCGKNPNQTISC